MAQPTIEAEIVFLTPADGGRALPIRLSSDSHYAPHLAVGDRTLREPLSDGHVLKEDYLGVMFPRQNKILQQGVPHRLEITLLYPHVDYSALTTGATFTLREGPTIVGHGKVIRGVAG